MKTYKLGQGAFSIWLCVTCIMALSSCAPSPPIQQTQLVLGPQASDSSIDRYVHDLAIRFKRARDAGGMFGVTTMVQECYRSAIKPFSFRECMILDAVGRRVDLDAVKSFGGPALPYWKDGAVTRRWEQYRRPANFPDARTAVEFMGDGAEAVMLYLSKTR